MICSLFAGAYSLVAGESERNMKAVEQSGHLEGDLNGTASQD
jgi:hypothetical protein